LDGIETADSGEGEEKAAAAVLDVVEERKSCDC
jgi:hypothetical protein